MSDASTNSNTISFEEDKLFKENTNSLIKMVFEKKDERNFLFLEIEEIKQKIIIQKNSLIVKS